MRPLATLPAFLLLAVAVLPAAASAPEPPAATATPTPPGESAPARPRHDPLLLTRLADATAVTILRTQGPGIPGIPAPNPQWTKELLDILSRCAWVRAPRGVDPMFAPEVRVHFRGDSIRVDWILSLEPFQSMLRIDGQPAMGAAVPEHLHLAVLDLVRQVYPSDSLLSYRYGVETERHRGDAAETEAKDEGAWAESDAAWQEDAAGCLSIIEDPPTPVTQVKPTYPEFAKDAQIEGRVILHVLVGKDGRVKTIKLIRGVTGLNEAAVDAVRRWVFKPGLKAGEPVCVWVEVPVDFHL